MVLHVHVLNTNMMYMMTIARNTYTQGKGKLVWDTWRNCLVLRLSVQSENETNDPLKSGPALAGPARLETPHGIHILNPNMRYMMLNIMHLILGFEC